MHWIGIKSRPIVDWMKGYLAALERCRATGLAAELAFWMFLSLVPLAAVLGLVAARLAMTNFNTFQQFAIAVPPTMRDLFIGELPRVSAWNGGAVGPFAAITFVWLASSGVHSIFDAIELSSGATPRPWWKKRLLAILGCVALSVGVALIVVLGVGLGTLRHLVSPELPSFSTPSVVGVILRAVVGVGVSIGLIAGLFYVGLPHAPGASTRVFPGATAAVLVEMAMGYGYGLFVSKTGDGGTYQAGLAVIGVTMTALYLASLSLLAGATLNHHLRDRYPLEQPDADSKGEAPAPPVTNGSAHAPKA